MQGKNRQKQAETGRNRHAAGIRQQASSIEAARFLINTLAVAGSGSH